MTAAKITVRITLDVEIDPETWDLIYGSGTAKSAIARDARAYAQNLLAQDHLAESGAILDVTETHK